MKIAIFGKIRSGKDTVGELLINEYNFKRFAFGDGIGEIINKYFPEAWDNGKPRKHYQHIGQELRVLNGDVWINYMLSNVNEYINKQNHFNTLRAVPSAVNTVVTDGRQFNEYKRLKEDGFLIVKVVCPDEIRIERMKLLGDNYSSEALNHDTEKQVDLVVADIEIVNDGTLDQLKYKVQELINLGV